MGFRRLWEALSLVRIKWLGFCQECTSVSLVKLEMWSRHSRFIWYFASFFFNGSFFFWSPMLLHISIDSMKECPIVWCSWEAFSRAKIGPLAVVPLLEYEFIVSKVTTGGSKITPWLLVVNAWSCDLFMDVVNLCYCLLTLLWIWCEYLSQFLRYGFFTGGVCLNAPE